MSENGNKKVTLPLQRIVDLYLFLGSFAPADLGDLASVRKTSNALEQMEKVAKGYI